MTNKLRTDAALKRVIKNPRIPEAVYWDNDVITLSIDGEVVAEISLREIIAKRKSLRGVNERLKAAIRPKRTRKP